MSFIGATGYNENQEELNTLKDEIDANASYINNLVGIPDPLHTAIFGINLLNPGLFGLVERAEVKIKALETGLETEGTTISGIETSITGIETEIGGIQGEITGIQGEITGIEGSISAIQFVELPALATAIGATDVIAVDARNKANRALDIWDYSGDNTYNKKAGNVGIGITFGSVLNNKLEVNGNINIPTGSKYKINNVNFGYSNLDHKLLAGTNINIDNDYKINSTYTYTLPTAGVGAGGALGGVKVDGTTININNGVISGANTYTLPTAGVGTGGALGGVKVDGSTITITNGVISSAAGTAQVNSDWTQTNTSLKSFIQNKPTAGTNISLANNTITNTITGSPSQNIIDLNNNYLIVKDKPDSVIVSEVDVPLTNEPTITSPAFTESIRTFTHSGGTEDQTPHTITIGQNTICDILIVGGGGGGGGGHGGGGGAGQLVLIHQAILSGTYTIKVGKGGNGTILAEATTTSGATRGGNSEFGSVIAEGGGANGGSTLKDGGSGAGGDGYTNDGGVAGKGLKNTTIDTFSSGIVYSRGNDGGDGGIVGGGGQGGGGGGAGAVGTTGGNAVNTTIGHGGDGLSGISVISYDFKTNFGNYGKLETDGNYWFAGGGAGGIYYNTNGAISNGGKGGGGSTPPNVAAAKNNGGSGVNGTGGGGAGGSAFYGNGGSGGSGIVIIKFKTIVNAGIPEGNPITHKTLNFAYSPNYPIIQADSTNLKAWYKFDDDFNDSSGNGANLVTNTGTPTLSTTQFKIGKSAFLVNATLRTTGFTFHNKAFSVACWVYQTESGSIISQLKAQTTNQSLITGLNPNGDYFFAFFQNDMFSPAVYSGDINNWVHLVFQIDTNRNREIWRNGVRIANDTSASFLNTDNNEVILGRYAGGDAFGGYIDDMRFYDRALTSAEISQLYSIPAQTDTYTLSVQAGTSIQVNNGTAQYLSGNYTISVGATQSSVVKSGIGQVGSDPYPLTNGSTIAIRYSMLQRITSTINIKKDGLIKYVPASGANPTTGSWNIIDLDTQPLTQFAGNLPANRLDNIDMSKVATGTLPLSRTTETLPITRITGNYEGTIPISLTSGNLPASRLDNIDMGKVATGSLDQSRVGNLYLGINSQFHRIVYAHENVVDTQGIWTNKFKINTNLHLNQYNLSYNYYQYFLSMSPNNVPDRHRYWFGVVKMSTIVGTDNPANTQSASLRSDSNTNFDIRGTSSTQGVWWLDVWVYTTAYCESLIAILH